MALVCVCVCASQTLNSHSSLLYVCSPRHLSWYIRTPFLPLHRELMLLCRDWLASKTNTTQPANQPTRWKGQCCWYDIVFIFFMVLVTFGFWPKGNQILLSLFRMLKVRGRGVELLKDEGEEITTSVFISITLSVAISSGQKEHLY